MIKVAEEIQPVISTVIEGLGLHSVEAAELVFRTGMAETGYRTMVQAGGGPAVGYFQVEPLTADDIWFEYLRFRPKLVKLLRDSTGCNKGPWNPSTIINNVLLQVGLCRIHYRRMPGQIPIGIIGQANYWKQWYNTPKGKGTVEHFLTANSES